MFLEVDKLRAGYGAVEVLHEVSLHVNEGEIVSILGANGAGKTTTLQTISGLATYMGGAIRLRGEAIHSLPSHQIVTRGLTQSPEGRRIFGALSVLENLGLGAFTVRDQATVEHTRDWIFELFPRLYERREQLAGTLSGGEQQMLAIARALMAQPSLLLLDEPSLGLAPLLVKAIFETVRKVNESGVTILIVEQNARAALKLATPGLCAGNGPHRHGRHGRTLAGQSQRATGLPGGVASPSRARRCAARSTLRGKRGKAALIVPVSFLRRNRPGPPPDCPPQFDRNSGRRAGCAGPRRRSCPPDRNEGRPWRKRR